MVNKKMCCSFVSLYSAQLSVHVTDAPVVGSWPYAYHNMILVPQGLTWATWTTATRTPTMVVLLIHKTPCGR